MQEVCMSLRAVTRFSIESCGGVMRGAKIQSASHAEGLASIGMWARGRMEMLGTRYSHLIEKHSEQLAEGLVKKLQTSERTEAYRDIPKDELKRNLQEVYEHLGEWLSNKTELELQQRYSKVGARRAGQGVPLAQVVWALIVSKEHLWMFLEREAYADTAIQLAGELTFILTLEQFFDRAIYFTTAAYTGV